MLLKQPERFGRVFALDPVTPLGMSFNADQIGLFRAMMTSREMTRAVMATAAASLFVPESLAPNMMPRFREGLGELQAFYERILEQTFGVSEGIWLGTPVNLNLERESGELERRMAEIGHPHLVLWGEKDGWIPAGRSEDHGSGHAGLPASHGTGHWTFDESRIAGSLRRLFRRLVRRAAGKRSGDLGLVLQLQFRQPLPVQQHDLPLGLAEEAENTLAVKM